MLGGINNALFFQAFGGFALLGVFIILLRWAFSKNPKLIVTPIKAGKKDQYGLLVPLDTPKNYIEAEIARQELLAVNIKATLTQTLDGPQLMVFEKDAGIARATLKKN